MGCATTGRPAGQDVGQGVRPNIIYLMLDEWGYYEMSMLGHPHIQTPTMDRFAGEGMRFTQALAGGPVCGPTRASLMLGQHMGHTSMRINSGGTPIRADDVTVATVLHDAGYATGGFGKWGCGDVDTSGVPEAHGFDDFFGYYNQGHAHSYYPEFLIHNSERVALAGNTGDPYEGETFSHDVIWDAAMAWLDAHKDGPFFLYLPVTVPHGHWGMPTDDPAWLEFADRPWTAGQRRETDARTYAAMLLMLDRQLGELIQKLKDDGIDENTVIFLCGDNGGQDYFHDAGRYPRGFFAPNVDPQTGVEFRGQKRDLWEGGLRIPMMVRWPGTIEAGAVSDLLWYFPDVMPTLADLAGVATPESSDGLSILPTLLGEGEQRKHEFLYWEYNGQVAVRMGDWKAIKPGRAAAWELYDLAADISETTDLAGAHPDVVARAAEIASVEHEAPRQGEVYGRDDRD
ncbi:arylsulfatase [Phycisphaeraceae bacterium D3-23]